MKEEDTGYLQILQLVFVHQTLLSLVLIRRYVSDCVQVFCICSFDQPKAFYTNIDRLKL